MSLEVSPVNPSMSKGARIREIRKRLGMTQEEFALRLGAPEGQAMVSKWERGKREPSPLLVGRIEELSGESLEVEPAPVIAPSLARRLIRDAPGGSATRIWIRNTIENSYLEQDQELPDWLVDLRRTDEG